MQEKTGKSRGQLFCTNPEIGESGISLSIKDLL
jgi:hypothetical protein